MSNDHALPSAKVASLFLTLVLGSISCSEAPTVVSPTSIASSVTSVPAATSWPVPHDDGRYGHESPNYPPEPYQCPSNWAIIYNNWNWLCANGTDRQFPRHEGFPPEWTQEHNGASGRAEASD